MHERTKFSTANKELILYVTLKKVMNYIMYGGLNV